MKKKILRPLSQVSEGLVKGLRGVVFDPFKQVMAVLNNQVFIHTSKCIALALGGEEEGVQRCVNHVPAQIVCGKETYMKYITIIQALIVW